MGLMNVVAEAGVMMIVEMNRNMVVVVGGAVDDAGTDVDTTVALDDTNPVTIVCC